MKNDKQMEESHIVDECAEIKMGENSNWASKLLASFPALKSTNYQLYFFGQLISLVGTWLQVVAEGYLVFQLSHSAFYVGLDAAAATIPSLFLSLFGGVIVDRFSKKNILILTQTCSMILAFILGFLTILGVINVWQIIVLAFLLGIVNAVNVPALQAFVPELIENKKDLSSAIALGAGMFNAARVVGPTVAGALIATTGVGVAFILNGISYIAVIIALLFINTSHKGTVESQNPIKAIKEGIKYAFSHSTIRSLLILSSVVSLFGWSYTTLMPVISKNIFNLDVAGLGYLYAANGLGALVASFIISAFADKIKPSTFIIGGIILFSSALILFTFTSNLYIAYLLLFIIGFGLIAQFAMVNSTIQHAVGDHMRGRVMSLYALSFLGLSPLGNFEIGYVADRFGTEFAIRMSAIAVFIFGLAILIYRNSFKRKNI